MTVEAWTRAPVYTVGGIGPYAIPHPYAQDAIRVAVTIGAVLTPLSVSDFTLTPTATDTTGNLYLTPAAAATHAGRALTIDRMTPDEQGWLALLGEREAGLMAQLDRMVQAAQEVRAGLAGAVRIREPLEVFSWADGTVPLRSGAAVISGPTAAQIVAANAEAVAAAASAAASAASAASALAKENSMLRDRGAWVTGVVYAPSDIFTFAGTSYITQIAHTSTTVAADLSAAKLRAFAEKGSTGAGTGDLLSTSNLSELTNKPLAYTNIGGRAVGKVDLLPFSLIDPATIITDVEGLTANKVANAVPVAKAVTDYIDPLLAQKQALTPFVKFGPFPLALPDPRVNAHGLGAFPSRVEMFLICKIAAVGMAVGDRYGPITPAGNSDGANTGFGAAVNATSVKSSTASSNVTIINPTTGVRAALSVSLANFDYEIWVWK